MMLFRALVIWTVQVLLFAIGMGVAGLFAHLFGPIMAEVFSIDELIPSALIFFVVAAALGWIGNKFWPEDWLYNPLL
jgi:MFS-type transporter involved in bile tolerance (Atg22 family)